ncbi:MAG: hypothetical protein ACE5JX_13535 [Acidobacteriota bacterium]
MEKLRDIHFALPRMLLAELDRVARERGLRRAHLLREAVVEHLKRTEAEGVEREMQDYAEALAPSSKDFVDETDAHTVQRLLRETRW